ncbi:lasso peptide biosynthesis B2 protein [Bacillus manliponensis]|uniref:lasso peptide biosynthesis B2 protein n=1 Tax=Bacillus manliponensis TaxID=574376 RepID=UPI003519A4E5
MLKAKIQIFFLLFYVDYLLNKKGLKETCEWMKEKKSKNARNIENIEELYMMCEIIQRACTKHFLKDRALCLHQSLVVYYILSKSGYKVDMCIGASKVNFTAHAWVEFQEQVINDTQDVREAHNILISI